MPKIPHGMLETEIITQEVKKLLNKGVIGDASGKQMILDPQYFGSTKKKDGSFRTILNLKYRNELVQYRHFKMELLYVFKIIKPNAWMASVALKDVFFTIAIHESHQKYFKFEWINKVYRFAEMPNGYLDAMQIFTKILKSV